MVCSIPPTRLQFENRSFLTFCRFSIHRRKADEMKNSLLTVFVFAATTLGLSATESATAQNSVLTELYGRGVHAYYAGNTTDAFRYLSMAIDQEIQDPRAYYFRGIVAQASGRPYEAESDWKTGAEMEANGRISGDIGRSLARFQGSARIKLEEIRQEARLMALANALSRSKQRYGEIEAAQGSVSSAPPDPKPAPPAAVPPPAAAAPAAPKAAANDNPFSDDMAEGQASVVADDALEGAMDNPFADDGAAGGGGAAPAADSNPFGGGGDAGADPFGGGAPAGGADPFGGGGAGGADPFGGGGDAGGADPFGGAAGDDPFGN
jgi:hypothetical protein